LRSTHRASLDLIADKNEKWKRRCSRNNSAGQQQRRHKNFQQKEVQGSSFRSEDAIGASHDRQAVSRAGGFDVGSAEFRPARPGLALFETVVESPWRQLLLAGAAERVYRGESAKCAEMVAVGRRDSFSEEIPG
jgi:hypothetical protein